MIAYLSEVPSSLLKAMDPKVSQIITKVKEKLLDAAKQKLALGKDSGVEAYRVTADGKPTKTAGITVSQYEALGKLAQARDRGEL